VEGRGIIRTGYAADLTIFDPHTIKACDAEWADDYPDHTKRLIQRSVGMHYVVVNGRIILEDGRLSGDLPGQVLRSSAHHAKENTATV
jgi:N-acyl-D-aspartate/D-glutamate deacylase